MRICPVCHAENEDDALYCKKCASYLLDDDDKKNKKEKNKIKKQKKVKNKTKHKTKVKNKRAPRERQKSSFFSKFLAFVLIIIAIVLAGIASVFAYHYYQENNIVVPDVVGYSYDEATAVLKEAKLSYQQKTKLTTDPEEVGVVVKQSKRAGSKTHENAVITLTVGILDTTVTVPDVEGMSLEDAISTLNQAGISYQVVYEESDEDNNIILEQSIRSGKKIDNTESITLTVSMNNDNSSTTNNNNSNTNTNDSNTTTDSSDVGDEDNQ